MKYLILIFLFIQSNLNAQEFITAEPLRFYESYETFLDNKPIDHYVIFQKHKNYADDLIDFNHLRVKKDGVEMKLKPKDYPSLFFTDENGLLHRNDGDGGSYIIFINGKYCYYLGAYARPVRKMKDGEFMVVGQSGYMSGGVYNNSSFPDQYWSEGLNGPVKKIKDKDFEKVLDENGLLKKYLRKKVKRQLIMGAVDYGFKKHEVYVEFFNLLNNQ